MKTQRIIVNGILEHDNRVLIAKRSLSKKIAPGKYHLPGGHVEFAETPAEAIKREFLEEFELDVEVGNVFHTFSYVIGDAHTVGISFLLSFDGDISAIKVDSKENDEVIWLASNDLTKYFNSSDHNYTVLNQYFLKRDRGFLGF